MQSETWNGYRKPPSEQKYSEDVSHIHQGLNFEPTREELNSLSKACSRLWELDMNRIVPGRTTESTVERGRKFIRRVIWHLKACSPG
jgi:poly(U)-specific endoribonuclease